MRGKTTVKEIREEGASRGGLALDLEMAVALEKRKTKGLN
jgi:hypothetical protein